MRTRTAVAVTAAASLMLAACGDDGDGTDATDAAASDGSAAEDPPAGDDPAAGADDLPDPNDDITDGIFAGSGVRVPVPDGFELDPMAAAQGLVAAIAEGGEQQMLAQAIDVAALEEAGEELTLDALVEDNRSQFPDEPAVDEAFELSDGSAAHQLVFEDLPPVGAEAPAEDAGEAPAQPDVDIAVVVADDGAGRLAQFTYLAPSDAFDDAVLTALLEESAFDPDSDPVPPVPAPAPEGGAPAPEGGAPAPEGDAPAPAPEGGAPAG